MAKQAVSILIDILSVLFVAFVFLTLILLLVIVICLAVSCSVELYNYYSKKGVKMKLSELKPTYKKIELYEYNEGSMLQSPQELDFGVAVQRYGNRKVFFTIDHEDRGKTEILVENYFDAKKREKLGL